MRILPCLAVTCAVVQAYLGALTAEPAEIGWSEFRNGGSSYASGELPDQWGAQKIAWQHELIGYGQSTPVSYGDRVFVTSAAGPMKE
jgi:hypothetical protein